MRARKRRKKLLILCAVIILLVPVYFFVRDRSAEFEKKLTGARSLTALTADQIAGIRYSRSGDESGPVSFLREDGSWYMSGPDWKKTEDADGAVPDQGAVSTLAASLTGVRLYQVITDVTDRAQYGLDEPSYTVEILDTSGQIETIYIGDENEASGKLYCMLDGDRSTVYAVSTALTGHLDKTAEDYMTEAYGRR